MNTSNGEVGAETLFEYSQKDDMIWGTYSGGLVKRGVLLGRMKPGGDLQFYYMQYNENGELNQGISTSTSEFLRDGRVILFEDWEWTGNKTGSGRSVIEEVKSGT